MGLSGSKFVEYMDACLKSTSETAKAEDELYATVVILATKT
jgi:hypothetical protein